MSNPGKKGRRELRTREPQGVSSSQQEERVEMQPVSPELNPLQEIMSFCVITHFMLCGHIWFPSFRWNLSCSQNWKNVIWALELSTLKKNLFMILWIKLMKFFRKIKLDLTSKWVLPWLHGWLAFGLQFLSMFAFPQLLGNQPATSISSPFSLSLPFPAFQWIK